MCAPAASSVKKLQELFPQLSKETLQDVVAQTGDGAFEILLELCSTSTTLRSPHSSASWSDDSTLESHEDLSTEGHGTGASWWDSLDKSGDWPAAGAEPVDDKEEMKVMGGFGDAEKDGAGWGKEAQEGWESIAEGPLSLNDWGIEHVRNEEESVCSSEGLYCGAEGQSKKCDYLMVLFADHRLDVATVQEALDDADGDLDLAAEKLLEANCEENEVSSLPCGGKQGKRASLGPRKDATSIVEPKNKAAQKSESAYEENYPSLETSKSVPPSSRMKDAQGRKKLFDSKLIEKAQALRRQFFNDPNEDKVVDLLESLEGDSEAAAKALRDAGFREITRGSLVKPGPPSVKPQYSRFPGSTQQVISHKSPHQGCGQVPPRTKTEMSQDDFEALYNEERKKANELGNITSQLFRQATLAYEKGDKDLAKKLSLKGQNYAHQHRVAQQQAAETIFRKRNSCIVNTFAVDLHGMHVEEALLLVQRTMKGFKEDMEKWPSKKIIRFVTGKGNHSPDNISRLSPALSSYLKDKGLPYIPGPGYFDVDLENVKI